jgi:hypothetical protein
MDLACRVAVAADIPRLTAVMEAAIAELQCGFLDERQIASSRSIMGIDAQLVEDGTYVIVHGPGGQVAGCGGWSRRATLFGNDSSTDRDSTLLDPAREPGQGARHFHRTGLHPPRRRPVDPGPL